MQEEMEEEMQEEMQAEEMQEEAPEELVGFETEKSGERIGEKERTAMIKNEKIDQRWEYIFSGVNNNSKRCQKT